MRFGVKPQRHFPVGPKRLDRYAHSRASGYATYTTLLLHVNGRATLSETVRDPMNPIPQPFRRSRFSTVFTVSVWSSLVLGGCSQGATPGSPNPEPTATNTAPSPAPNTPAANHWAFQSLTSPELPAVEGVEWIANPIDTFVLAKLEALGRAPAPPALPEKLARRVSLVLTGLPLPLAELDAFGSAPSREAYEALVDRLLASPRYGEHLAVNWLDIARYSDTDGFQYDINRPAWPWRDWVIDAFNSNLPYDQFVLQQVAGDLLPEPTPNSILATAFNRNHAIQGENGLLLNSFRDRYVTDRVETVSKAWMGITMGCAKCHDHKYEPILAQDFYRVYDCFNQLDEGDNGPSTKFRPTSMLDSPLSATLVNQLDTRMAELTANGADSIKVSELSADKANTVAQAVRVMADQPSRRTTQLLQGGRYDAPTGDPLRCSAPVVLPPFKPEFPDNRLGFAQWLTMPENPLTARVVVNRFWAQVFGTGLVPSLDNFGVQTSPSAHAALLDWLAVRFIESGWDVKALLRLMVTSNTFQQAADTTGDEITFDATNQYHGRGPRFRLGAEAIRDSALFAGGLLVELHGGPPAYPYQPPGLWEELSWEYNLISYPVKSGDSLYRRSVYSFWKKTLPPPMFSLFDAPEREVSCAYRETSVTPLQSLALLNDRQFIQAAEALARQALQATALDPAAARALAFRTLTARTPTAEEEAILAETYASQYAAHQAKDPAALPDVLQVLATTEVVRIILNLNETVTVE